MKYKRISRGSNSCCGFPLIEPPISAGFTAGFGGSLEWKTLGIFLKEELKMGTKTKERRLAIIDEHREQIAEINGMINTATNAELEAAIAKLVSLESEYRGIQEKQVFAATPDIVDALRMHDFPVLSHKNKTEKGKFMGVEYAKKNVNIDLRKYAEFHGMDMAWYYEMQSLNKRLTLKVAKSLGLTAAQLKTIDDSYDMNDLARAIDLGKTPDSNTQVVKHIQRVFDLLSPDSGKVNNHDLAFIMHCYGKKGKAALKVMCAKHSALQGILLDVFHRVVTNGVYDVDYKVSSNAAPAAGKAAAPAADAPKAEAKGKAAA
jgi:hypothetical protein